MKTLLGFLKHPLSSMLFGFFVWLIALIMLLPSVTSSPEHYDERQYAWSAGYFGNLISHFDFRKSGNDPLFDPGWSPHSYWNLTQPAGTRLIYWSVMAISGVRPPKFPYSYNDPNMQGAETEIPLRTHTILRIASTVCAATGLALIILKFGAEYSLPIILFLLIPHIRRDIPLVLAEGPLLLGIGLCLLAYKTRWFPFALGLVGILKLTGLALWLWALIIGYRKSNINPKLGFAITLAIWCLLTPPSWYFYGPVFLVSMFVQRIAEYIGQSFVYSGPAGLFFPSRYAWPFELGLLLLCMHFVTVYFSKPKPIQARTASTEPPPT